MSWSLTIHFMHGLEDWIRMLQLFILACSCTQPNSKLPSAATALLESLQGRWNATIVEEKGKRWGRHEVAEVSLDIADDVLTYVRDDKKETFRFKIDVSKTPQRIDLQLIAKNVAADKYCHGIVVVEGGLMRLCLASEFTADDPESRPRNFATGANRPPQGQLLFVFEKQKR